MKKLLIIVLVLAVAFGCKKPFTPVLSTNNQHYLVVEGNIDGADSTFFQLSRTKNVDTLRTIIPESGAVVSIESDASLTIPLTELKPGTYAAAPVKLDATHKYRLHIKTTDSKEYVSDYVEVKNSQPIDSVGFTAQASGVTMYVNSHDASNLSRYYRWSFTETWQFHSEYPSGWLAATIARPVDQQIYTCFTSDTSSSVILATTNKLSNDVVFQSPLTTIPSTSEKIETKYSILVKQYALTPDAYNFWQNLQSNTEKLGSIFSVLPSQLITNFHCTTDPNELVVGYLSAGSTATKRVFVTSSQLPSSYQAVYPTSCELDTTFNNPNTVAQVHSSNDYQDHAALYTLVTGLYLPPPDPFGHPTAYTYSTNFCVDCTIRGKRNPPSFWK